MFCNYFFENCAIYEIMWKNIIEPESQQMTVWRMCISCWIPKTTNTYFQNKGKGKAVQFTGLEYILSVCNVYCFYTASVVA
jgi:hypothetical protein